MSSRTTIVILLFLFASISNLFSQQQVSVVSRCGGIETVTIPSITDNDADGMDDGLELKLLQAFMPTLIQFHDDDCPGPALDGSGTGNLVVSHIYPLPQQYTNSNHPDSVKEHPQAIVPSHGLHTGLIWYRPVIIANCALVYGKDCGLLGHTADVEGFSFTLHYIGADSVAGWMYDTVMGNWMGRKLKTTSHAGTPCEHIATEDYQSIQYPAGYNTIYASPDKHGEYLTVSSCNSSFICDPGCGGTPSAKSIVAVNIGEPNAPLVSDLGAFYAGYAGEDPWTTAKFLAANGGNAGAIRDKMVKPMDETFLEGVAITSASQICQLYQNCFGPSQTNNDVHLCFGDSYLFNGQQLTASGVFRDTLANVYGCDSISIVQLTALPEVYNYNVAICDGSVYPFNGQQLVVAGVYRDTLTGSFGCDSVVALNLSFNAPARYSYNVTICPGENYDFNGNLLTSSGSYLDTLVSVFGCDSLVHLSLTVDALNVQWLGGPDTLYADGHAVLLTGGTPAGGAYTGTGVSGNLFLPAQAIPGANVVTYSYTNQHGCTDSISKTIVVVVSDINEQEEQFPLKLFPNPVSNTLVLESSVFLNQKVVTSIYDLTGKELKCDFLSNGNRQYIDIDHLVQGIYWLKLETGTAVISRKIIKTE